MMAIETLVDLRTWPPPKYNHFASLSASLWFNPVSSPFLISYETGLPSSHDHVPTLLFHCPPIQTPLPGQPGDKYPACIAPSTATVRFLKPATVFGIATCT